VASANRLLTTVAYQLGGRRTYALEGAIFVAGAAVQWLRDGLGLLTDVAESEILARSVDSTGGVAFVPALAGLGSPWWDSDARGLVSGITRGTTRAHLVRAALEAIAHQVADVVDVLPERPTVLRADGGATGNGFLMQLQADLLDLPLEVAAEQETTALGAAALAARRPARVRVGRTYEPAMSRDEAQSMRALWIDALNRTRT
jgi:glycerol kinase